jgi:hypothetical protein
MDLSVLAKKISSYRSPKGQVRNLPNELLGEILHSWEQWTGTGIGFYSAIGVNQKKMAKIMGKAKQLKRDGAFDGLSFTEVVVEGQEASATMSQVGGCGIELVWDSHKIIRFGSTELLLEFLKKAA